MGISWLYTTGYYSGLAYPGVVLLALYMALYPALIALIMRRLFSALGLLSSFLAFSSLWILAEWFRSLGRMAMPWIVLGQAWAPWPWAIQLAEFGGQLAVSLQILFISAALLATGRFLLRRAAIRGQAWGKQRLELFGDERPEGEGVLTASVLWIVVVISFSASALRLRQWEERLAATGSEGRLKVAALQPNIAQDQKMASYDLSISPEIRSQLNDAQLRIHEDLIAKEVPPDTALLVMPESTFPDFNFQRDVSFQQRVERIAGGHSTDIVFGALRWVARGEKLEEVYNSAFFVPSGGKIGEAASQDKMRLVPFGEFIPYHEFLPEFIQEAVSIGSFNEGKSVTIFETHGWKFGTMICFESSFGNQARKIANAGAQFLTVITNDGWYRMSAGPPQHRDFSYLRAVETRRPVIRSANTGISAIIDPAGRAMAMLPLGERGVVVADIAPQNVQTIYSRWGNAWLVSAAVAALIGCWIGGAKSGGSAERMKAEG